MPSYSLLHLKNTTAAEIAGYIRQYGTVPNMIRVGYPDVTDAQIASYLAAKVVELDSLVREQKYIFTPTSDDSVVSERYIARRVNGHKTVVQIARHLEHTDGTVTQIPGPVITGPDAQERADRLVDFLNTGFSQSETAPVTDEEPQ